MDENASKSSNETVIADNAKITHEEATPEDNSMLSNINPKTENKVVATQQSKINKPKKSLMVAAIVIVAITVIFAIYYNSFKPLERMSSDELLNLGEKYLLEMNYEQAVVYFNRLIEIESINPRGYTGLAEAYLGLGDVDKAIEILQIGMIELPEDFSIKDIFDKLISQQFENCEQLISNLEYSSAVEHFIRLIGIVPLKARGYTGCAEAYLGLNNIEKAIEILNQGLERLSNDPTIKIMLENLLYEQQRDFLAIEATPILVELAMLCYSKEYGTVFEKMHTEDFDKVTELSKFLNRPNILNTEYGKIGLYEVDSDKYGNYMIYYGDYVGDTRDGSGVWLGYYEGQNYIAKGLWKDDKPNGEMQIKEWNSTLAEDVTYRIITGNVVNGLWNGNATWAFEHGSESSVIFPVQFDMGNWVVIEVNSDYDDGITRHTVSNSGNNNEENTGEMAIKDIDLQILRGIIGYGK